MLFESAHVRVTAEYGVGTLWLAFPGEPVNALNAARLAELDSALAAIEPDPFLNALVVRSAKPAGFCAGLHPSVAGITDRSAFAARGQRVLSRLSSLPFVTVALVDGPCLGAGFELALACDFRLCCATPATLLGFPGRFACFGGTTRVRKLLGRRGAAFIESGRTLSGREARDLGLVDRAFCSRRAKIELRTFLDELERRPRVPERARDETGFAAERRAFAALTSPVARLSESGPACLAPDSESRATGTAPTDIDILLARGFITPLEAEQLRAQTVAPGQVENPLIRRAA